MNRSVLIVTVFLFIFFLAAPSLIHAQLLSPTAHIKGKVDLGTKSVFLGKTILSGNIHGFPVTSLLNIFLPGEMYAFPLFGENILRDVDRVIIVETSALENITIESLGDIADMDGNNFSDVYITITAGGYPFLLGSSDDGIISLQSEYMEYAISVLTNFRLDEWEEEIPFLVELATSEINMSYMGNMSMLIPLSNKSADSHAVIYGSDGAVLWNDTLDDKFFLIDDNSFTITQNSSFSLFPIYSKKNEERVIDLSIYPTSSEHIDMSSVLKNVESSIKGFGNIDLSDLSGSIRGFDTILSAASPVLNGAWILVDTNDTLTVDNTPQSFSKIGFIRYNELSLRVSDTEGEYVASVVGDCKLIFLGDHFYTAQASDSENGVAFPLPFVGIWVLAAGFFILSHFVFKKEVNQVYDEKIRRPAMVFHIVALIVAFILMDREISYQFGISAIDVMFSQSMPMFSAMFVLMELSLWTVGFLIVAIPIRIVIQSILRMIMGIGKGGRGIGKGVGVLSIWFFSAFYVQLFINIILTMLRPDSFFPVG